MADVDKQMLAHSYTPEGKLADEIFKLLDEDERVGFQSF